MALRGTLTHRKTRRLAKELNVMQPAALGLMEALWHVTAEQAPDGAIGRMSDVDLADEMFFTGDAAELVRGLLAAGLLDADATHRLIVHDWHEHSDDATDNKLGRAKRRYANGQMPRMKRLSKDAREELRAAYSDLPDLPFPDGGGAVPAEEKERLAPASHEKPQKATESHYQSQSQSQSPEPESGASTIPPTPTGAKVLAMPNVLVLPVSDPRPEEPHWAVSLGVAARWVMSQARITKPRSQKVLELALGGELRRSGRGLRELAELAAERYRAYLESGPLLRFRWGPDKFFGEGHWLLPGAWPFDESRLADARRARQGMR